MSLRILFAMHAPADPSTAVYVNVQRRSEYLRSAGHTVDILMVEDLRVGWLPARLDPLVLPLSLARLKLGAYDVVVFHSYLGWAFHAARQLVDRAHRIATITMFHGVEPLYHQAVSTELARQGRRLSVRFRLLHHVLLPPLLRFATRRSDGVFCLNREEAEYLVAQGWVRGDRVHVVRNGFAPDEVVMGPRDYRSGRRFLTIVQWLPAKGIRYLVEAFTTLAMQNPSVELVCVGTGADADTVLSSFPAHVRSRVTVLPRLDRSGIREQLQRADAFVFPSLYEGFGIALLEALASGLPVISTNVGLATDMLQHERDALIVPVADAGLLADAMERVARDEGLRTRLGAAASAVARPLTWSSAGSQYNQEALDVVASRGRGAARRGTRRILLAIHGPCDPATAVFSDAQHRRECLEGAGHTADVLGAEDLRLRWIPARLNPLVLPLSLLRFNLTSYDVIIFHSYLGWGFHLLRWLVDRAHRLVTITTFHGLEPVYHRAVVQELARVGRRPSLRFRLLHHVVVHWILRWSCRRSDAVFCLNSSEAAYLTAHRWARPERVHVVPNSIDVLRASTPRDYRSAARLVCVAQWLPAKGVRYLVEAFTQIARKRPELRLTCAGTGEGVDTVLAAFPGDVRPRVTVLPRLEQEGVFEQLRQADIFVFPTLSEGFSLALVEALATGIPVVCTRVGAAPDILRSDVDAITVPAADATALVTAVERLIGDEALRRSLGQAGQAVAARFSWPEVCPDYRHRILQLVASHARR